MKPILSLLFIFSISVEGIITGNTCNISDFLCPDRTELHIVQENLLGDNGMIIQKINNLKIKL